MDWTKCIFWPACEFQVLHFILNKEEKGKQNVKALKEKLGYQ